MSHTVRNQNVGLGLIEAATYLLTIRENIGHESIC